MRELAIHLFEGREFWGEKTAITKVLRLEHVSHVPVIASKPV